MLGARRAGLDEGVLAKAGEELVELLSGHARLEAVVEVVINDLAAGSDRDLERVERPGCSARSRPCSEDCQRL